MIGGTGSGKTTIVSQLTNDCGLSISEGQAQGTTRNILAHDKNGGSLVYIDTVGYYLGSPSGGSAKTKASKSKGKGKAAKSDEDAGAGSGLGTFERYTSLLLRALWAAQDKGLPVDADTDQLPLDELVVQMEKPEEGASLLKTELCIATLDLRTIEPQQLLLMGLRKPQERCVTDSKEDMVVVKTPYATVMVVRFVEMLMEGAENDTCGHGYEVQPIIKALEKLDKQPTRILHFHPDARVRAFVRNVESHLSQALAGIPCTVVDGRGLETQMTHTMAREVAAAGFFMLRCGIMKRLNIGDSLTKDRLSKLAGAKAIREQKKQEAEERWDLVETAVHNEGLDMEDALGDLDFLTGLKDVPGCAFLGNIPKAELKMSYAAYVSAKVAKAAKAAAAVPPPVTPAKRSHDGDDEAPSTKALRRGGAKEDDEAEETATVAEEPV